VVSDPYTLPEGFNRLLMWLGIVVQVTATVWFCTGAAFARRAVARALEEAGP
jgi:hypothetical protein